MKAKTGAVILGLVSLLSAGCTKNDVSVTNERVMLTMPDLCQTVKDLRLEYGYGYHEYQVLCSDSNGNLSLYHREVSDLSWKRIDISK